MSLKNKTAVITGAGGVLCSVFARALASAGCNVALLDLNAQAAERVAGEIESAGGRALAIACNVLEKDSLNAAKEQIHAAFGKCDLLLNGAGGNSPKCTTTKEYYEAGDMGADTLSFFDLEKSGFDFVFSLNLMGTLLPTQIFAPDMLAPSAPNEKASTASDAVINREGCAIINISSMNAFTPLTKIPAYSAAKSAVSNFTQWLAVHFAPSGLRVNAIAPGFFITQQNHSLLFNEDGSPTPRSDKILAATPMGRYGKPEELVGTLLWLADSEKSGFVTGTIIPVDGGFSAYSGV